VLLAVGVVAVTFVIEARTDRLLRSITVQAESIRTLADTVESAVARQSVVLQGNLSDPKQRAEYDAARSVEDTALAHLEGAVGAAGPAAMSALSQVRLVLRSWHRNQDELLAGTIDLATFDERLAAQSQRFQDVVGILDDVKSEAARLGAQRRLEIDRLQRFGAYLTTFLALAAVIAAGIAYRFRGGILESRYELMVRAREAEAAVRSRDEVLAIVSHDLRNGLNAISGSVELAADEELLPPDKRMQQLDIAKRSAHGMHRLIADLLDASRMDEGKLSVEPKPEPVQELLTQAEAGHRLDSERRGIDLRVVGPSEPVCVQADGERVAQVLGNLVGNALKFTPEGGAVTVTAVREGGRVRFTVADTGPGIPPEHMPHIFDRFYQVRATGRAGAGLGLAIARGLVEAHGSELEVRSRPGEGTTFSFVLPVAPSADPA
jgi:signal transduction histidine kinase